MSEELSPREVEYLIAVFECSKKRGYARQYEIREELKVAKPTASLMIKKLAEKGYVKLDEKKITIAEKGEKLIREILWKHGVLEHALVELGLLSEQACAISWRIYQDIPREAVGRIWENLGKPDRCPCGYRIPDINGGGNIMDYEPCLTFRKNQDQRRD